MSLPVIDVVNQLVLGAAEPVMSFDLMNMWSLAVAVERILTYSRAGAASRKYAAELATLLPAGKFKEAVELAHTKEYARGYLPKVLGLALEEYRQGLESHATDGGKQEIGAFDIVAAVNRAIDRSTLRTITAIQAMAATGSGGLGSVSAGIAEALVTTAFGLLVAIPAVMFFNYFTNRVEEIQVDVNDSTTELVDFFIKEGR